MQVGTAPAEESGAGAEALAVQGPSASMTAPKPPGVMGLLTPPSIPSHAGGGAASGATSSHTGKSKGGATSLGTAGQEGGTGSGASGAMGGATFGGTTSLGTAGQIGGRGPDSGASSGAGAGTSSHTGQHGIFIGSGGRTGRDVEAG